MAQDFYRLFNVGNDDKSITTIDPSGIALAAIKELNRKNEALEEKLSVLSNQNNDLQKQIDELKKMLGAK